MALIPVTTYPIPDKFNKEKAFAALYYIINKLAPVDMYKLLKILYLADKMHLAKYGRLMFDEDYQALEYGPVPANCYSIIKMAKNQRSVQSSYEEYVRPIITRGNNILKSPEPDMDELSGSEIKCLEHAIGELKDFTFDKIKMTSHGFAWENAKRNGIMRIEDIAKEAGANEAMIAYINENVENSHIFA